MVKYTDIMVKGSVENVRNLVERSLGYDGFTINWISETKGRAEKGSKGTNILLGALATHYVVEFEIFPSAEGRTLRLNKIGSGASGGLLGMRKANKQFDQFSDKLASWFREQGVLLSVEKE